MLLKGMNDTMGSSGLVPTMLVFVLLPMLPIFSTDLPSQRLRLVTPITVRHGMETIVASKRLYRALAIRSPLATRYSISPGDMA